ncbi:MAG TPA: hypothetical protein VIS73_12900 [Rhodocyclaceae bacterium]
MIDTAAIVGLATLVAVIVFFWKRFGIGSGHALGNRIAAHIGMPRNLFYLFLDNGAKGSSRDLLAALEQANLDLDQASVELAPSLARGIERLEERFGTQGVYEKVKPSVARLMSEFERKQSASEN